MSSILEYNPKLAGNSPVSSGRWLQVVSQTDPKYGGLSAAVPALGLHLEQDAGLDVSLAAFCLPGEEFMPAGYGGDKVSFWPASRISWRNNPLRSNSSFVDLVRQCDGVHIHGLWEGSTMLASSTARRLGVPYILSAHGMLEPWALRQSRIKKLVYSGLVERSNVRNAACLHALTHSEAQQFVRFGAESPIAVIPNGVDLPARSDATLFLNRFPKLRGKRLVLFLARLHRKKGLELLVEAWSALAEQYPEAHLVLAGPDSEGTQAALQSVITARGLEGSTSFTGMLRDNDKWSALAACEGFVLPSHSEGLSVSILEAMGMGLPVVVTEACNMPEVAQNGAGWQIPTTAAALTQALGDLLANSPERNRLIGARGARLIRDQYTWPKIAAKIAELYAWVQGGEAPRLSTLVNP